MRIPFILKLVFNRYFFQKLFAILLLVAVLYLLESFLVIFLITFLFSFLFLDISKTIRVKLVAWFGHIRDKKTRELLTKIFSLQAIITITYLTFIVVVVSLFYTLIPHLVEEWKWLLKDTPNIVSHVQKAISGLESSTLGSIVGSHPSEVRIIPWGTILTPTGSGFVVGGSESGAAGSGIVASGSIVTPTGSGLVVSGSEPPFKMDLGINNAIAKILNPSTIESIVRDSIENLKNVGIFLTKLIIAMILSYVFLIDREKISSYLSDLKRGNFAFLYEEYQIIFGKIGKGFGLIFKAQAIIAFINAVLTAIGLLLISLFHGWDTFPYIITLGVIVFIFGFVPVLGTFLSAIPILIIGYNYGGGNVILAILGMAVFIHAVEAYYLNPKIVSSYMELPVFLTFLVLLVSEHLFGFVGLLIGVPIFYILVDVLKDMDHFVTQIRHASQALHATQDKTKEALTADIRLSRSGQRGK